MSSKLGRITEVREALYIENFFSLMCDSKIIQAGPGLPLTFPGCPKDNSKP